MVNAMTLLAPVAGGTDVPAGGSATLSEGSGDAGFVDLLGAAMGRIDEAVEEQGTGTDAEGPESLADQAVQECAPVVMAAVPMLQQLLPDTGASVGATGSAVLDAQTVDMQSTARGAAGQPLDTVDVPVDHVLSSESQSGEMVSDEYVQGSIARSSGVATSQHQAQTGPMTQDDPGWAAVDDAAAMPEQQDMAGEGNIEVIDSGRSVTGRADSPAAGSDLSQLSRQDAGSTPAVSVTSDRAGAGAVSSAGESTSDSATADGNQSAQTQADASNASAGSVSPFDNLIRQTSRNVQSAQVSNQADTQQLHRRIIDQVVREVSLNTGPGRSEVVVKLTPPELGTLRIQVMQDASGFTTHIQTASDQVRGLLQAHLPALTDALNGAGVRVDSISVAFDSSFNSSLDAYTQNNSGQQAFDQNQAHRHAFRQNGAHTVPMGAFDTMPAAYMRAQQAGYSWLA